MTDNHNHHRAAAARNAIRSYSIANQSDSTEDAVLDFVTDLGHFCDLAGIEYPKLVTRALSYWTAERTDPENTKRLFDQTLCAARDYVERVSNATHLKPSGDYADFDLIERLENAIDDFRGEKGNTSLSTANVRIDIEGKEVMS